MSETIGDRIRKVRCLRGLSGAALARDLSIPRQHLHAIETNTITDPRAQLVGRIAAVLRVTTDYLIDGRTPASLSLATRPVWELQETASG
jgi:transcriptional regulator with XRE-family HTH domain